MKNGSTEFSMKNQGQGVAPKALGEDRESLREFISMAVHDLREPLRAIRLGSQLAAAQGGDNSEENRNRGTRFVEDGIVRIETLIQDIAEYCYGEVREFEDRDTDLEMSLLEAKTELAVELKTSGTTVTNGPLPTVSGNPTSLAVLLRCLIGNACKFRGEDAPRIHLDAVQQDGEWVLSVRDNGGGFDPVYRERIFRPFERLNGKQFPGSGLGLTLAKRIVEQHGGQIWAESALGEGSTFHFTLPLTD
jgi:light-regulated signal transduction histidine kinase (bacteriophytochrome)